MSEITYSKKQIAPLIAKYKINPESNVAFKEIIEMFNGQTNYQIWAIKLIFENITDMVNLKHIKEFADENQTLIASLSKKNLVAYKTKTDFSLLNKEIAGALSIMLIKRCIEKFNTDQREMLKNYVFKGEEVTPYFAYTNSSFKMKVEFFKKFDALSESRKHKLIVTASALRDINALIKHIEDSFNASYTWDKDDLLSFIKVNPYCKDVQVVFDNGPIVVLEIPNFEASKTICGNGRTAWCLTRESNFFSNYVTSKPGNRQFFYFDFSKPERNEVAHVGFTVNKTSGIVNAHSTNNNSMLGEGVRIGGKNVNIHTLLAAAKIDNKVFIHLNGIKGFNWNLNDVIDYINKNSNEIAVSYNDNGRIIVKVLSAQAFEKLCGNTLVNVGNLMFDNTKKGCVYVLLDLNLKSNDDYCMVTMQYVNDSYGSLSLKTMYDAYNNNITRDGYLNKIGIPTSAFLNRENIKPSILLHKYIDEKNETDAVNLIKENSDELDVNYEFNNRTPIFTAILSGMFQVFEAIISNPKFNSNTTDPFGEPLLQSIMFDYRQLSASSGGRVDKTSAPYKMIESILNTRTYDFNALNTNLDSAISVAAERESTNWILDALVVNPNVNINTINDINCSPFGNAIRCGNRHAIEMIGRRPDLVVRAEDYDLAKRHNINIDEYIKPTPFEQYTTTVVNADAPYSKIDASEYAKVFAASFAKNS